MNCPCCQTNLTPCNTKAFRLHPRRLPQDAQGFRLEDLRGYTCDSYGLIWIREVESNYLSTYRAMLDRWWKHKISKGLVTNHQDAVRLYKSKDYIHHLSLEDFLREYRWYASRVKSGPPQRKIKTVQHDQHRLFE